MTIDTYHDISDTTLDHLDEYLENLGDELDLDGFDVEYAVCSMAVDTYPSTEYWMDCSKAS